MATELFNANLATTTVSSGGTDAPSSGTQETWTVASSAMFGAASTGTSQFHVTDTASGKNTEIIAVTNVSGTTWTVTRGAESTTPVTHSAGFTIYQVVTTGFLSGQIPSSSSPLALTAGGTGLSESTDAALLAALGAAPLASPALTGTPTAPTAAVLTDSTQLATTAYADSAVAVETSRAETAEAALVTLSTTQTVSGQKTFSSKVTAASALILQAINTYTGAHNANASADFTMECDATAGAFAVTLGSPARGQVFIVKKIDSTANAVTVSAGTGNTIAGQASLTLAGQYDWVMAQFDTTNSAWLVISASVLPLASTSRSGFVQLDGTASDIAALGVQAAGSTGKAADAGHVHPATGVVPAAGGTMTGNMKFAAGTTSLVPVTFQAGTNLTAAAAGDAEFDGTAFYLTAAASSRQVVDAEQVQVISGNYTLANNTSAQPLLNATTAGALTVQGSTAYFFECVFWIASLNSSSHAIDFGLGGSASFTSIMYQALTCAGQDAAVTMWQVASAAASAVSAAGTTTNFSAVIRGTMRINAGGTIIPQVTQVTNSAAAVVQANSFFRCWPIGAGSVTNVGDWS